MTRAGTRDLRGSNTDRRSRREYLVKTFRANVDLEGGDHFYDDTNPDAVPEFILEIQTGTTQWAVPLGQGIPACRCYCCGFLLTVDTVTADRIKPGCQGGTYRRNNIRPACKPCQSKVGGGTRSGN